MKHISETPNVRGNSDLAVLKYSASGKHDEREMVLAEKCLDGAAHDAFWFSASMI